MTGKLPLTEEQVRMLAEDSDTITQFIALAKSKYGVCISYPIIYQFEELGYMSRDAIKQRYREKLDRRMFVNGKSFEKSMRRRILEIRGNRCESCGITEWEGDSVTMQVHHIDGNRWNNELSNLMVLCPNCHALTDNYGIGNITGFDSIAVEEAISLFETTNDIEETIRKMHLPVNKNTIGLMRRIVED